MSNSNGSSLQAGRGMVEQWLQRKIEKRDNLNARQNTHECNYLQATKKDMRRGKNYLMKGKSRMGPAADMKTWISGAK